MDDRKTPDSASPASMDTDKTPSLRDQLIGFGEKSIKKSWYSELKQRSLDAELFRALLDEAGDAIFLVRASDGLLLDANKAAGELLGLDKDKMLKTPFPGLFPELAWDEVMDRCNQPLDSRSECTFEVPIGNRMAELHFTFQDHGGTRLAVVLARDTTERRRYEEGLKRAKEEAEAASRAKSEFLANMSHEIRTPLNGVLGMLQLLRGADPSREQRRYIEVGIQSGQSLLTLLSGILDLSAIEAGRMVLRHDAFNPVLPIRLVMDTFEPGFREKGLNCVLELSPSLPERVAGDEGRIQQILFNLVGNALKFTERGSVTLSASATHHLANGAIILLFTVRDTGPGIACENLHKLMEPFTQADGSSTRKYQGAGLGLGIVHRLATIMGGTVCVSSAPGQGATFYVTVRVHVEESPRPDAEAPRPAKAAQPAPSARSLSILVVEDDRINRVTIGHFLENLGHRAVFTESGTRALKLLMRGGFDCVLMDVQLPDMDGMEATRAIRASRIPDMAPDIPVIAVTAHAMKGDRERFLEAGMNEVLNKPVDMDELDLALRQCVPSGETE